MRRLKLPMKTDTSVGTASGFPIPGAVSFQLYNNYLNAPSGVGLVVVVKLSALVSRCHPASQYLRYLRFPVGVGVWLAMQLAMNAS
jgi:hypothetical protein